MSEQQPRVDRGGIHIESDLAESLVIEEELDSNIVGPYRFPAPTRRRISGWIFVAFAAIALLSIDGGWVPAIGFVVLAIWQFASAWPLNIDGHLRSQLLRSAFRLGTRRRQ